MQLEILNNRDNMLKTTITIEFPEKFLEKKFFKQLWKKLMQQHQKVLALILYANKLENNKKIY